MLKPADILLLDEPTNDLDLNSLEVLESSMMDFSGALVLVTHDRYLLDRVSRHLLSLDGKGNARFFADLSQWEDAMADEPENAPPATASAPPVKPPKLSLSKNEAKELKKLEEEIKSAEAQCEKARAALADPEVASNAVELFSRQELVEALQKELNSLMKRWEDLESRRVNQ
jgi:ATP-binding cassette subfamily F protein uup